MTQFLTLHEGTIAHDVAGSGPLIVLAHGMGDSRASYRFMAPQLVSAGYRVAAVDLRGCGESSAEWPAYSRTDIAGDLIALVKHLGGPAVLVGQSISGGAATIAAAQAPELINGIVELCPFTRKQSFSLGDLRVKAYRKGTTQLALTALLGSVKSWHKYLDLAFPGQKPADWAEQLENNRAEMTRPGRMKAMRGMIKASPTDAGEQLGNVRCQALIVMGSLDPDWADPRAEGEAIIAGLPDGLGELTMLEGAGHYPHTQFPDETAALVASFMEANARA